MAIKAVIFDCDGVLFSSHQANLAYYNQVFEQFARAPVTDPESPEARICHTAASPMVFAELLAGEDQQVVLAYAATIDYRQFLPKMVPEPGVVESLQRLSGQLPLAVATNRGSSMQEVLAHFNLTDYFSVVVTSRDVQRPKPYPDMLHRAVALLAMEEHEVLFVGDSELDQMAADRAGVHFIAYKSDLPGSRRIDHHRQLDELLARVNSET